MRHIVFAISCIAASCSAASAATLIVGLEASLGLAAVKAASPWDTAFICPGIYAEQVVFNKALTVTVPSSHPGSDFYDPDGRLRHHKKRAIRSRVGRLPKRKGITANDAGTTATIQGNVVTGLGPSNIIAQIGIQLFEGTGALTGNIVTNNIYSLCAIPTANGCPFAAVAHIGLLIDTAASGTTTSPN